ncbi:MAG: pilus assembly protein TadG-related protein, partial [Pseudomonadota bacterium]
MKTLIKDDQGSVSFFVLVLSIALLAMMGLVMDTGRGFTAHTQVQAYVDNVALAMARELDGEPGAIDRAKAIMNAAGPLSSAAVNKSSTLTTEFGASSVDTFDTFDPSTGGRLAQVGRGKAADVDRAVQAARQEFDSG